MEEHLSAEEKLARLERAWQEQSPARTRVLYDSVRQRGGPLQDKMGKDTTGVEASIFLRLSHLPTGIVVSCQNERSQLRNRDMARKILRARLYEQEIEKKRKELQAVEDSKLDIASGSQIRSYVLHPYRMVKDHRTKHETSNTDRVLDGDLDDLIYQFLVFRGVRKRPAVSR